MSASEKNVEVGERVKIPLRARRLTVPLAIKLWTDFFKAHGEQQMMDSYGWPHPPDAIRRDARMYSFERRADKIVVGWGEIVFSTTDASDDEAKLSTGVFPEHQRKGHNATMIEWLVKEATRLGADYCSRMVFKDNPQHYDRVMKLAMSEGSEWIYAGDIWYPPPGMGIFIYPIEHEERKK